MAHPRSSFRNIITRGLALMVMLCIYGFSRSEHPPSSWAHPPHRRTPVVGVADSGAGVSGAVASGVAVSAAAASAAAG